MHDYFYSVDARKYRSKLAELDKEAFDALVNFNGKAFAEGALSVREKELIAVAAAHITRCPYCIESHTKKAKAVGATEREIAEAIFVAIAMSAGASFAHSYLSMQSLEE